MNKTLIDWFAPLDPRDTAKEVGTVGTVGTASPRPQKTADEKAPDLFPPQKEAVGTVGTAPPSDDLVPTVPTSGFSSGNRNEGSKPAENCASSSAVPTVPTVPTQNDSQVADPDDLEERAAIIAEGSGCPFAWAEGLARLDPNRPPKDVPPAFWRDLCDTAGAFTDQWAAKAADLGWTVEEVFGCDRHAPFARLDRRGLVWSLVGCSLVDLTKTEAVIEMPSGNRLKHRRRGSDSEPARAALAWDQL